MLKFLALVYAASWSAVLALHPPDPKYPVVLIPGVVASVLEDKLDREEAIEWYCTKKSDWRIVFLSFREALSPSCLCDELMVNTSADQKTNTNTYGNQPGVDIRAHDFGGLGGVAALDPSSASLTATFQPLISALQAVGYRERETLWGAPYDWRLAADGLVATGYADELQSLIEMAVDAANGNPAVVVAHSMGNLVLTYFLQLWGREWAEKHVRHVIAASGPYGGAVTSIKGPVSGDNLHLHFPHNLLHSLQGVAPSGPWLFPSPHLWRDDEVIVRTNSKRYTAHDLETLLTDAGLHELAGAFPNIIALHEGLLHEGTIPVPLTCVYGNGLETDTGYIYPVDSLQADSAPEPNAATSHEGDGTVNLRSLKACAGTGLRGSTDSLEIHKASHLGVLTTKPFLQALARVLELPKIPSRRAGAMPQPDAAGRRGSAAQPELRQMSTPGAWLAASVEEGWEDVGAVWVSVAEEAWDPVAQMVEAAEAVLLNGCVERQRLQALLEAGGVVEEWQEAALAWHRHWYACGDDDA